MPKETLTATSSSESSENAARSRIDLPTWQHERERRNARLQAGASLAKGKVVEARDATKLLEAVVRPGDRVCLEGDNQKQADSLSAALLGVDPAKVNDLHMVQSGIVLPEHLDLFERGVAKRLDFAYSGPQSERIAGMLFGGKIQLGAVHTYLELLPGTSSTSPRTSRWSRRSVRTVGVGRHRALAYLKRG